MSRRPGLPQPAPRRPAAAGRNLRHLAFAFLVLAGVRAVWHKPVPASPAAEGAASVSQRAAAAAGSKRPDFAPAAAGKESARPGLGAEPRQTVAAQPGAAGSGKPLPAPSWLPEPFASLGVNPADITSQQYGEAIRAAGTELSLDQQRALAQWIQGAKPGQISDFHWHWLVNDTLDLLLHQSQPLPELTEVMVGLFEDPARDPVLRDYAVQHMVDWLEPVSVSEPYERDPLQRAALVEAMVRAAAMPMESFSGTALLALHTADQRRSLGAVGREVLRDEPAPEGREIDRMALAIAKADNVSIQARITAFQVAAQRGLTGALEEARQIAANPQRSTSLRLSAIAYLGALGSGSDARLLRSLPDASEERIGKAVGPAVARLASAKARPAARGNP